MLHEISGNAVVYLLQQIHLIFELVSFLQIVNDLLATLCSS
jgi:hypothetical protein